MEPKLLVPISKAFGRLQIADTIQSSVTPQLTSALLSSQTRMEELLDTTLQSVSRRDVFFMDTDMFSGMQVGGYFKLMLKSGFLDNTSVSVFAGEPDDDEYTELDRTYWKVDYEKGIVLVKSTAPVRNDYVTVQYSAGFSNANAVPEWLQDAIISYSPMMFYVGGSSDEAKAQDSYKTLIDNALAIISPYARRSGLSVRPLYSQVVD